MSNGVFNREPYCDEFVSPALCSSLAGASTSNHLSLQSSDPQVSFVCCTSSSLFSALIACERCPLWFCLHATVLSGRECRKVSCVCFEDEGATYSPAEDKPVSFQDMTYLLPAHRISTLSVNITEKGRGLQDWRGEGWKEKHGDRCFELCTYRHSAVCVFYFLSNVTTMHQPCQVWLVFTHSLLIRV